MGDGSPVLPDPKLVHPVCLLEVKNSVHDPCLNKTVSIIPATASSAAQLEHSRRLTINSNNRLVFVTETPCVPCVVGTEFLNHFFDKRHTSKQMNSLKSRSNFVRTPNPMRYYK